MTNFKFGENWRGNRPHHPCCLLVASVIGFIRPIQLRRKLRVEDIIVSGARRKMRGPIENPEEPVCADLPNAKGWVTVIDREPAARPIAHRGVFRRLAGNLAPPGTRRGLCGWLRLTPRGCLRSSCRGRLRFTWNIGRDQRCHDQQHQRSTRERSSHAVNITYSLTNAGPGAPRVDYRKLSDEQILDL